MIFSSIPFLYYFLPIVLILYFAAPKILKNAVLLLASLIFYGWGEPKYVFLMLTTVMLGYGFGILIEKFRGRAASKVFLILSVLSSLAGLLYFKYADFFIGNVNAVTGLSIPFLRLALPIGISFYTFQILSYSVDVYRGEVAAQKNPLHLATYVALFPQLIAGPIVRYSDVARDLTGRRHSIQKASDGITRFVIGLAKKILIANTLGQIGEAFLASTELSVLYYWLFAFSYMLQIYFDFSGYSDMAIGLGKLFGFEFLENFNYPFISRSISEFWRRWHISLGSWFRDYVYIPLGGNRVKRGRMLLNIFVVWFLTGFWHGAEWNFVVWGLYFGIMLTLEKFFFKKFLDEHKAFGHIYTLFFVTVSFMIFAGGNLSQAFSFVAGLFGFGKMPLISTEALYYLKSYSLVLIIAAISATPLPKKILEYARQKTNGSKCLDAAEIIALLLLVIIATSYLVDGSFNPFLYFRF